MKPAFEKLISPQGCSIRFIQGQRAKKAENRWHYHPEIELTLIEQGSGTRLVGDHVESYGVGDLVLVGSNLPHHWAVVEPRDTLYTIHRATVVQFAANLFGDTFLALPEMEPVANLLERAKRGIKVVGKPRRNVARMMNTMRSQSAADRIVSLLQCLLYMASIDQAHSLASDTYSQVWRTKAESRLNDILTYIHVNLADPELSQNELASLAGMTPSAFSRFFRKATQRTVIRYINEQRIGLACRKLSESESPILDICLEVGFDTVSYFNRRFLQFKGMTPREFRERFRGHGLLDAATA